MKIRIVNIYKPWVDTRLLAYLRERGVEAESFSFFQTDKEQVFGKFELAVLQLRCLWKIFLPFFRFRDGKILVTDGHYALMVMTRMFGPILGPDFHLFLYNFYLHGLGGNRIVKSILRFLLNTDRITVIAQSPDEVSYFSALARREALFVPYREADKQKETSYELVPEKPYVFAGGYSNRDYQVVLECAARVPDQLFVIAASKLNKDIPNGSTPTNVIIYRDIDLPKFDGLLQKSQAVIIPIKSNAGSSGQMVAIAAMRFSKPVIYTDSSVINYYFKENVTGIPVQMGDADSLVDAIHKLHDMTPAEITAMGSASREYFLSHYSVSQRNKQLFDALTGHTIAH